jgi:FKBP-type peptidyl-prolyl cis-trans isomerase
MQIDLLNNGGVLKTVLKEGAGADAKRPREGDVVRVLYSGRLKDSTEPFDSSLNPDSPFSFTLGKGLFISLAAFHPT